MRFHMTKYVLPVLLALLFFGLAVVAQASESADSSHAEAQVVAGSGNEHNAPADQAQSAAAADAHGAVADAHGEAGGHAKKSSITGPKLKDLFWRTVNFIALLVILIKFLAKPIGSALAGRQQRVKDEYEDLVAKRDSAERSYKEFESRLAGMEKEMDVIVERAIALAKTEKAKILESAEKAAEDIKRQAEAAIQAEIVEAKRMLRDQVADQATKMAEELLMKNLTPEDQVKITEQYLDRVGAA